MTNAHTKTQYVVKVRGESGCTILSALALVPEQVDAYHTTPGRTVDVFEAPYCAKCDGAGRVRGRARMSWKVCPCCKGAELPETLLMTFAPRH